MREQSPAPAFQRMRRQKAEPAELREFLSIPRPAAHVFASQRRFQFVRARS
jgi:hypothetical protein